jgi:polyisoprenoid-binding protein YceI
MRRTALAFALALLALSVRSAAAEPEPDHIKVLGSHAKPVPNDPVEIAITSFRVVEAKFDPANLDGATALLELDLSSIKTNSERRDGHLRSADYLDTAQFPKAVVKVSAVKKARGGRYTAKAQVSFRGLTATWPVSFEVVERGADTVRVRAEHKFARTDLGIGKSAAAGDPTADHVTLKLLLTFTRKKA